MIATLLATMLSQADGAPVGSVRPEPTVVPAASSPSPPDAARVALARRVAEAVWPVGTLARMHPAGAGFDPAETLIPGLTATLAKGDPHFPERMAIMRRLMAAELAPTLASRDPFIRAALADAYARHFDAATLEAAAAFYATHAGRAIAGQTQLMTLDPAVLRLMTPSLQDTFRVMAIVNEKMKAATSHLPPPPKRERRRPPATGSNP